MQPSTGTPPQLSGVLAVTEDDSSRVTVRLLLV
jgi:hypothetical protein